MSKKTQVFWYSSLAVLLSTASVSAQQVCEDYVVMRGDNLQKIARETYGNAEMFRLIYNANRETIGENPSLIMIGATLSLPCNGNAAPVVEAAPMAVVEEPVVSEPAPVVVETTPRPIVEEPVIAETAPVVVEEVPVVSEPAPVVVETTPEPIVEEPVIAATAPVVIEEVPVVSEPAPVVVETTPEPIVEEPVIAETAPVVVEEVPVVVQDAALSQEGDSQPLRFATGNNYAPFADETLPGGGMFTQLVERAMYRADWQSPYNLTFINDWQAHLDALLPSRAYDLSFPWSRPNCEAPETLSASDLGRCEDFVFSDPFYEIVEEFYVASGNSLAEATSYEEFDGKRFCRPEGFATGTLDAVGLRQPTISILRPATVEDCITALTRGDVDVIALDSDVAESAISSMELESEIVSNPYLSAVQTLHVIAYGSNERAVAMIDTLNDGIIEMYETGEWYDLVSTALAETRN